MQKLLAHIEYLLWHHECVILPGMGAFVAYCRPAYFAEDEGVFYPPVREVCFNSSIVNNDGLIANSISRRDCVSFEEASGILARQMEGLRVSLANGGQVTVGDAGVLSYDSTGKIIFEPKESSLKRVSRYGLVPVEASVKEHRNKREREISVTVDSKFYNFRLSRRAVRVAAMVAFVIMVGISFLLPYNYNIRTEKASLLPTDLPVINRTESAAVEKKVSAVSPSDVVTEEPAPEIPDSYFLVVATLKTEKEVEIFLSQHKNCGYDLQSIGSGKVIRIYAESSADDSSILHSLVNSKEFTSEFPGAWIWHKK